MWTSTESRQAVRAMVPFTRPHRRLMIWGILASAGVVFFRLALPWPLRGIMEVIFPSTANESEALLKVLPAWGDPVLWFCGAYVLLAIGAGISEMIQRINFKRFTTHTVHDLRSAAVRGVIRQGAARRYPAGEMIARIIGDTARVKAGMNGIFVHLFQNGLLFLAICILLLIVSLQVGLFFFAGGLLAIAIGMRTSAPVAETTGRYRKKEGEYAVAILEALETGAPDFDGAELNQSSAQKDVRTTKLITLSSLATHVVLAAMVALVLWRGAADVERGRLAPGVLFLFVAYALTVHRRLIQIGRQIARSGKVLACLRRVGVLLEGTPQEGSIPVAEPLRTALRLEGVRLRSSRGHGNRPRVRDLDLALQAGSRVAVLGKTGAGKSSLLRLLAGLEVPTRGRILWDDRDLAETNGTLRPCVGYLPQEPVFARQRTWQLLGLANPAESPDPEQEETLRRIGAWDVIGRWPRGWDEKVASAQLSRGERRALKLGATLLGDGSVWLLDEPLEGLGRKAAQRRLEEILARGTGRTIVVAFCRPVGLEQFDRVWVLRRGRMVFDGTPAEWEQK